jgi:aminopeptidase N
MRIVVVGYVLVLFTLAACGSDDDAGTAADAGPGGPDATLSAPGDRDILSTDLDLDVATHAGLASIVVAADPRGGAHFEIGDLSIASVKVDGTDADFTTTGGILDVPATPASQATILVAYTFRDHSNFDGWDPTPGLTFLWPYFCKNLFPCDSRPSDGLTFTLSISGTPAGQTAVYPESLSEAPSYQPAVAMANYTYTVIGTTTAGTEVGVYALPGDEADAEAGAASLAGYFDWYEQTLGPYAFGDKVASVDVEWGAGDYGGMEHHPFWHIDNGSMADANTHAHEAAHGWFGDGIRLRCWEDFVLSEGTVTYLAARAIEEVDGAGAGAAQFDGYREELMLAVADGEDTVAWPTDACNSIDIFNHPVWSVIPYMKGALFYRAIEEQIGKPAMDGVLHDFYTMYEGRAAGMQDMLDMIQDKTGFDPGPLAAAWLRGTGIPQ